MCRHVACRCWGQYHRGRAGLPNFLHVFQKNMIRLNSVFHKIRPKFDLHSGFVWSVLSEHLNMWWPRNKNTVACRFPQHVHFGYDCNSVNTNALIKTKAMWQLSGLPHADGNSLYWLQGTDVQCPHLMMKRSFFLQWNSNATLRPASIYLLVLCYVNKFPLALASEQSNSHGVQ